MSGETYPALPRPRRRSIRVRGTHGLPDIRGTVVDVRGGSHRERERDIYMYNIHTWKAWKAWVSNFMYVYMLTGNIHT